MFKNRVKSSKMSDKIFGTFKKHNFFSSKNAFLANLIMFPRRDIMYRNYVGQINRAIMRFTYRIGSY